ncbi:Pentatricopeptide repeat-containing protein [Thalictrum thalictroides]|uniref:Pentatricopeptide repeat-containing protein n=1 Tax=Thalictrum thalictroides TaxID=46969 RepID=A0A7J6V4Q2_THATH|nr:Pentatricopeptide repeat-containing protein [Thalictrum thalictroides]
MPQRSESSWSTMLSGYVRAEMYVKAVELFYEMWVQGIEPNGFMLASLLTACNRSGKLVSQGTQVHGLVVKYGLLSDVFVSSALLHFYATYGFMFDARKCFEEMPERNVVSWTSLMVGYSTNGDPEEVLEIYQRMRREGVRCNQNSFSVVISSCGLLEDELLGRQVLSHVVVTGLDYNVSVANALISMFGCFGNVEDAYFIFKVMEERDTISWNSIISAYSHNQYCEDSLKCFRWMRHGNVKPDSTTLSSLVSACSNVDNLKWGMGIHDIVIKFGLDSVICVCNTLLTMYSESGRLEDAVRLFRDIPEKDLISWNSMMASFGQNGEYQNALGLLADLHGTNEISNHVTFASALAACSCPEALIEGKTIHGLIFRGGRIEHLLLGNALITMYAKCGVMRYAKQVFQTMPQHDVVSWNALIGGHMENEEPQKALQDFKWMREDGMCANYITIVNVLGSFSTSEDLRNNGMPIHAYIEMTGFESDSYVRNSLLTMYAKCGDLNSSNFIFEQLDTKNIVSWNAMVAANAHHGCGEAALKFFAKMHQSGLEFDHFSFSGGLAACANLGLLEEGQQLHNIIIKKGFESDLHVANAAMDMYGKCGEMNEVLRILPTPSNRPRLSWNILISGFSRHGYYNKARDTFHHMLQVGAQPNHVTFVALLSACNHGGLVEEGLAHFYSMVKEFGVPPAIEHCVCIVDLLGRSGRLIEAEIFVKEMPVPANDHVWRSLLSASRTHNNLELSRKAANHLIELDPSDDSAYVLLSNVCAINGRWEDVDDIRRKMKSNKIKKKPGCSWVKVNNKVSTFGMGDQSHPQTLQIYGKLTDLRKMIKEVGYVPDMSFALHDTDEEDKEHNLWNHSEKLALAFGLLDTPEGSTLRIFKNLRVCGDCHSVYKFVSKAVQRRIVLRDPYRFHHFSNGKCSCCDYW